MTFAVHNTRGSKLKAAQVLEIREKYAGGGYTFNRLAREYHVTSNTISNIVNGITWQQVPKVESESDLEYGAKLSQKRLLKMLAADPPPNDPGLAERLMREAQVVRDRDLGAERALDELAKPAEGTSGGADE